MFNQPNAADEASSALLYFRPAEHENSLVLFETVIEAGREFDEMAGAEREFRIVSYVDLDQDSTPRRAKVTATVLVRRLPVGATNVLGRIVKAKAAKGFAWVIEPHTPADAAKAKAWLDGGRPAAVDPFAVDAAEAQRLQISPQQYAELKRLGMLKDATPAPY